MASTKLINIQKEIVTKLEDAPIPESGVILQTRTGKAKKNALGIGETFHSAIFKVEQNGPVYVTETGLSGDEHVFWGHGGYERAVHQYDPNHYASWRAEGPPKPELFDLGGFGENVNATNLTETNVCIGDTFQIGDTVQLQVMEPRHPCFKLNARFQWPRALKRIWRTGRHGWNYRVLQTGMIKKGDTITLVNRPFPQWSLRNIQRMVRAKSVPLVLLAECTTLPMTDLWLDLVKGRLKKAPKRYTLTSAEYITPRVRKLTFTLKESIRLTDPGFETYAFVQIRFGPEWSISRSYSVVEGDLHKFSLGVSLDDNSRGGSAYIHHELKIGDEIEMTPGANPKAAENDRRGAEEGNDAKHVFIIGGIGVTAFLSTIRALEKENKSFEIHYAVRSLADAAFLNNLPRPKTTVYSKADDKRLDIDSVVPRPESNGAVPARIFCCGPARMMQPVKSRCSQLGYAEHTVHFESFDDGGGGTYIGEEFEVEVNEPDTNRHETLTIPTNKSLLDVLNEAGFDIMFSCRWGGCGTCRIDYCDGKVDFKSQALKEEEKKGSMQACIDRGIGKIVLELD